MEARGKDLVGSAALLCVAAGYYGASRQIPISSLADNVGPRGIPQVLAVALGVLALVIGARALLSTPVPDTTKTQEPEASLPRALGLLAAGALYVLLAESLGYASAVFLLIAGVALYEGAKFSLRLFAIAAGGALFFWLLFVALLGVPQPEGLLF